ncbi:MAG: hypothetical protein H3C51_01530 [Rubellimicrobium sp.]|nr:hypothetical protein [Rubellimicrobium sp.]
MQLTDAALSAATRDSISDVVRARFPGKVRDVRFRFDVDNMGDDILTIEIHMSPDTTADDFRGRFIGLTELVRKAMGDDLRDVFPFIRPMEAHA